MYTQQKTLENNRIYDTYKDKRLLFSSSVSKSLGLKQQDTIEKIGMEKTRAPVLPSP